MPRFLVLVVASLLVACTPRAALVVDPQAARYGTPRPVFVATSRAAPVPLEFGPDRDNAQNYSRFDIVVPSDREAGSVTYPGRKSPDPTKHFLATRAEAFSDSAGFRAALRQELNSRRGHNAEAVIYIHGFNNNFADGVLRIAQLTHDLELPGVSVHYSWPSAAAPLKYAYDRDSVLFARDGLERLILDVEASGARSIIIVAHSLGSHVTMEALRQIAIAAPGQVHRRIDGVILISPDIAVEVFRSQVDRIGTLPDPFGIFVSHRDRALGLSARLTGQKDRLGNIQSVSEVGDLDVTLIDVTEFSQGLGHFTVGNSPALLQFFSRADALEGAFQDDASGDISVLSSTVLGVQNATGVILSPETILSGGTP